MARIARIVAADLPHHITQIGNRRLRITSLDLGFNVVYYSYNYTHYTEEVMRTIQMTLDDELVATVDQVVKKLKTTRSAFARRALSDAVKQVTVKMLEDKHKKGYGRYPVDKKEFNPWESEQAWGDQ